MPELGGKQYYCFYANVSVTKDGKKMLDDHVAHIDHYLCRGCGRCADICPEGAAHLKEITRGTAASWIDPKLCTGCGNCMAECPTGAITMPGADQEYFEGVIDAFLG